MRPLVKTLLMLLAGLLALVATAAATDLQIKDAWLLAAPPGAKVVAAYLEISNKGDTPRTLVGASSPAFASVSIHRSVLHGEMTHMEHLPTLTIAPHSVVLLKPGGLHLMLSQGKKPLRAGDQLALTLNFDNGDKLTVSALVRSGQGGETGAHQHMDHSAH